MAVKKAISFMLQSYSPIKWYGKPDFFLFKWPRKKTLVDFSKQPEIFDSSQQFIISDNRRVYMARILWKFEKFQLCAHSLVTSYRKLTFRIENLGSQNRFYRKIQAESKPMPNPERYHADINRRCAWKVGFPCRLTGLPISYAKTVAFK